MREYATSASDKFAIAQAFVALYRIVFFGIWQTLDGVLAGIWAFGVGWLAWQRGARLLAGVLIALGLITAGFAAAHVSGVYPSSY
jgi:hypothetical protein